jgi:hypothetical protein
VQDLSLAEHLLQLGLHVLGEELLIAPGMVLVQVDAVGAQGFEGGFELLAHVGGRARLGAVHVAVELVAELGGDDPLVAVAGDGVADEGFARVIAVTLGGIDEVQAGVARGVEDGVDLRLGELFAPFAAELPRANADHGDVQVGLAEAAVFHG